MLDTLLNITKNISTGFMAVLIFLVILFAPPLFLYFIAQLFVSEIDFLDVLLFWFIGVVAFKGLYLLGKFINES